MKKILNKYTLGCLSLVLVVAGCSKNFINKTPNDSLLTSQALGDANALQSALNGAYNQLGQVSVYGRDLPVVGDLMADNTYVQLKNSNRYISQYNYSVTKLDAVPSEVWPGCYAAILRANQIIDSKLTGTKVNEIKAQAYAIRALMYFKLVTYFAKPYTTDTTALGVPLVLHYAPYALPTRNTVGTVYNQMVSDLKAAMPIAPAYVNSVTLNKYAIEGLLARVYLYMADYKDAEAAATDVINNSGFSLVSAANLPAFWANPGVQTDQTEVMFEVNQDVLVNNGFDDFGGIYFNGYADLYCSGQLYNLYSQTDARIALIDSGTTAAGTFAWQVVKFPNAGNSDKDNLKVIRLAEVYLIGAESAARLNDPTTAQGWLNTLMTNRDPAFAGYSDIGQTLINDIIQERRKELAFEGDRFFDLNRLGLQINRAANAGALPAGIGNVNLTIAWPDNRRVAPIPNAEIQANPNIASQQNPGY
ncbi:MAG TPA: RagB/SusD family nutrient uptake outer membrane protein [Puia sp.]|nr:RagB/SusD family nutrient uptake outer membrane protein [Puia sp.]